jgi:hypothetical protein
MPSHKDEEFAKKPLGSVDCADAGDSRPNKDVSRETSPKKRILCFTCLLRLSSKFHVKRLEKGPFLRRSGRSRILHLR